MMGGSEFKTMVALIVAAFILVGCGAGLRPGCKEASQSGWCKYQAP